MRTDQRECRRKRENRGKDPISARAVTYRGTGTGSLSATLRSTGPGDGTDGMTMVLALCGCTADDVDIVGVSIVDY